MLHIVVVNKSTLVSNADVRAMTRAVNLQLRFHAAPAWEVQRPPVEMLVDETKAPAGATVVGVFDDAEQAGDLGWHTETAGGVTFGRVFARPVLTNGGDALHKPLSIASVLSHECLEAMVDPSCNRWADNGNGKMYALEIGDPVEADSYPIPMAGGPDVTVSNFVLPSWFDAQSAAGKHDWLGHVTQPFTMTSGGYVVYREDGSEHQQFGEKYPAFKLEWKASPLSRTARRMRAA